MAEIGLLCARPKCSTSKVVTSITTPGYFMLIAKYGVFWGEIGKEWKRLIAARKKIVYGVDGRVLEPASLTTDQTFQPMTSTHPRLF